MTATYRVLWADLRTGALLGELPVRAVTASVGLNQAGSLRCSLPLAAHSTINPTDLYPARSALYLDRDGIILAGGILWTASANVADDDLELSCEGHHSYLRRRVIRNDLVYTAADQAAIAKNLIEIAQLAPGGNLGIITPTITTGVLRDRTYLAYERKPFAEAIEQLAAVENGFDWRYDYAWDGSTITTTFRVSYPPTGRTTAHVFELGVNCDIMSADVDGITVANGVDALGAGEGNGMALVTRYDLASLDDYPLLEDVLSLKDVVEAGTLEAHANRRLQRGRAPMRGCQLQVHPDTIPVVGSYQVGDQVRVRGERGWLSIDDVFRIVSMQITVDESGESIGLDLAPLELFV